MSENVYRKALELLGPNGEHWIKHHHRINDDFCLSGVLSVAADEETSVKNYNLACKDLLRFMRQLYPKFLFLEHFNDAITTQFEDVRVLLEKAAIAEEEKVV